jgi:hypothetical protein
MRPIGEASQEVSILEVLMILMKKVGERNIVASATIVVTVVTLGVVGVEMTRRITVLAV